MAYWTTLISKCDESGQNLSGISDVKPTNAGKKSNLRGGNERRNFYMKGEIPNMIWGYLSAAAADKHSPVDDSQRRKAEPRNDYVGTKVPKYKNTLNFNRSLPDKLLDHENKQKWRNDLRFWDCVEISILKSPKS